MERQSRISGSFRLMSLLAAVLVVAIHLQYGDGSWLEKWLKNGLCQVAVPWFFFAAGFWTEIKYGGGYAAFVRKRVRTLLIPFFLANALWFVWGGAFNFIGVRYFHAHSSFDFSAACLLRVVGADATAYPMLVATWFLRALFVLALFTPVLRKVNSIVTLLFLGAAAIWLPTVLPASLRPVNDFFLPVESVFCYALGLYIGGVQRVKAAVLRELAARHEGNLAAKDRSLAERIASLSAAYAFPIYLLHFPVMMTLSYFLRPIGLWGHSDPHCLLIWAVVVALSVFAACVLRKCLPRFAALFFGGRGGA